MHKWLMRIGSVLFLFALAAACVAYWALRQTRSVPEFYRLAHAAVPDNPAEASQQLEDRVEQLQADVRKTGKWQAEFTDDEINAWLLTILPEEFPNLMPVGASDPRVVIADDKLRVAAKYRNKRIDTVVSLDLRVEITPQPNMLAVRLENLRAGALPLPVARFAKGISREASRSDLEVLWDKESLEEGPVALVTIPSEHDRFVESPVIIESVRLRDGVLALSGRTGERAREAFRPQGPMYRFASLELIGYAGGMVVSRSIQASSSARSQTTR